MKKSIAIISLITLISFNAMSQDLKGKILLGGNIAVSFNDSETSDYKSNKSESYSITAPVGYFVSSKYAVGLLGKYSYRYSRNFNIYDTYSYQYTSKTSSYLIGPYVRRYFPVMEKLMIFVHLDSKLGSEKYEQSNLMDDNSTVNTSEKAQLFDADLYPGLGYRITNKLMLEAGFAKLHYSSSNREITKDDDETYDKKSSSFTFLANNLSFGLTLTL